MGTPQNKGMNLTSAAARSRAMARTALAGYARCSADGCRGDGESAESQPYSLEEGVMRKRVITGLTWAVGMVVASSVADAQALAPAGVGSAGKVSRADVEVRQMLTEYFKTIERHELSKFLAYFAEGEGLTVFEDKEMYDWKAFVAFAEGFFQQVKEITFDLEKCTVSPLSPTVAVATGVFRGTGKTASGEPLVVHNSYTFVLVKQGGRWRIKHVHESSL